MKNPKTYAFYFPNWHADPLNDKWHGKGWTEWECVKHSCPRFEGHNVRTPLWGYEDESDPKVMAKKIQTAHDYGISGFIFDFYWFKDLGQYRINCLNEGFLKAENNELLEFSVMWCNHNPIYAHPAPFRNMQMKDRTLADGGANPEFFYEMTQYCIDNYFCKPNYQRVDGKVYFGIWNITGLIDNFGGLNGTKIMLDDFRRRTEAAGYELHLACSKFLVPGYPSYEEPNKELANNIIKTLGIDSIFTYAWPDPVSKPGEWPKMEYSDFRKPAIEQYYYDVDFLDTARDIVVSPGWDSNGRTTQSDYYQEECGYPYWPITVNNTPEEIEKSFMEAKKFIESGKFNGNMLNIVWNEWTEGMFFEPDNLYGYGYLEAHKKVFGDK